MKLALARAMLMKADVLLLDEPTNHLDVANVKWLQEYLKRHTDITSLIVSHDSGFLDEVCTDIYHYEQKKLVCYPGNLAAFVKVKPEGKSYYTLSASNVQFRFPAPGILSGIKSNTRAILRMTNCTYTYPGAPKPSLQDASLSLSLSSRVAIIGGNGAGKSTFIKMLTGETIPQGGKVEKHPNLRIGYIKQHALEHVEMHLENDPQPVLAVALRQR
jgi:ATPase components of ABC transporters with duplicated ATPase domains